MDFEIPSGRNEPELPRVIARGVLFVRTAGMREAPEKLLTELFRETFFERFAESGRERQLDPEFMPGTGVPGFSIGERGALYATRGRKKKTKRSSVKVFYGAPYPSLARNAWPRLKSDRVVRDHFLNGPLAQSLHDTRDRSDAMREAAGRYIEALLGMRSVSNGEFSKTELLSAISTSSAVFEKEKCVSRLVDHFSENEESLLALRSEDPLASRIKSDFDAICRMERQIARIQWLDILKCFLRLSISTWLLAQMRMTVALRSWVLSALDRGVLPDEVEIIESMKLRYRHLFHPTLTPTDEISAHVEQYMKARVEVNILLYAARANLPAGMLDKQLVVQEKGGGKVTILELLTNLAKIRGQFAEQHGLSSAAQLAVRHAERYRAWTAPLRHGQGKNINEFLLVLRRSEEGDTDDGYLLTPAKGGTVIVFAGPMLLKTIVLLADRQIASGRNRGKLVLSDIEDHFRQYGVEFGSTASARPRLIAELSDLGLLRGSPDAGDSAEVTTPFALMS